MPGTRLNVHLFRDSFNTPWGFRLQGGKDLNQPLTVQRVFSNSPAEGELQRGDVILSINNRDSSELTHKQAQDFIKHGGGQVQLIINRPPPGYQASPLSPPIITQKPRAPSLQQPAGSSAAPGYGFQPTKVTMNKYGGSGPEVGSDFSYKGFGQTAAQRYEPKHDKSAMLNRLQTSLDNLTLSPRSPEVHTSSPFYQPYEPSYQHSPQQLYTPTGLLLEQQRLQEAHDDGEGTVPVWERRKQFQQAPVQSHAVRTHSNKAPARISKPRPVATGHVDFGTDYKHPSSKQPQTGWRPVPQIKPSAPHQTGHYASKPAPPSHQAPVYSAPPAWQRKDEEDTGTPAWGSSLKTTGAKPWELEDVYANDHQQVSRPPPPTTNESGERDWSQSAVLRFITQEDTKKSRLPPPAVAPKPAYSPVQAPRTAQSFYNDGGASEF